MPSIDITDKNNANQTSQHVDQVVTETQSTTQTSRIKGLSQVEMNDPQQIRVTVSDHDKPIVVLFGPPECGKTMTLIRLTRFLNDNNYTVSPDPDFRPSFDKNYKDLCLGFNSMVNSDEAADASPNIAFMLVDVFKDGNLLCHILEAPGEHYFSPTDPEAQFPNYVQRIINTKNRKVWMTFLMPDWKDLQDRRNYVLRIKALKSRTRKSDDFVLLFNKVDETPNLVRSIGEVNEEALLKYAFDKYPGIDTLFQNTNPISSIWRKYDCTFVPFQTGTYGLDAQNRKTFEAGPDEYCETLWNTILKYIHG